MLYHIVVLKCVNYCELVYNCTWVVQPLILAYVMCHICPLLIEAKKSINKIINSVVVSILLIYFIPKHIHSIWKEGD